LRTGTRRGASSEQQNMRPIGPLRHRKPRKENTLRKWNWSRVVYEHHYDQQRSGEPLTFDDLDFDMIEPVAGFQGGQG